MIPSPFAFLLAALLSFTGCATTSGLSGGSSKSALEDPCMQTACSGPAEALPASLIGLALLLGVTVAHELL